MAYGPIDMSEFEEMFADERLSRDMDNETFEEYTFLRDRIGDLVELINFRKGMIEHLDEELAPLARIQESLNEVLREIRSRKVSLDSENSKLRTEIRDDENNLASLQRRWKRLQDELNARRAFLAQRDALDFATKDAPWRVGVEINGKLCKALEHQLTGAHRVVSARRALLADKPGLGKTLQSIMVIDMLRELGQARKVIIFTPKSVLQDYERAVKLWSPTQFVHVLNQSLRGLKTEILTLFSMMDDGIIITNYEVWRKDKTILDALANCRADTIILDEAHVLKGKKTATLKGIKQIVTAENQCPKCLGTTIVQRSMLRKVCSNCEYYPSNFHEFCSIKNLIGMTGTPILNKPQELWPLLNLIDSEGFPDEASFLDDYCVKIWNEARNSWVWTFGSGGSEALLKKLGMKYTSRNRDSAGVVMPPQEIKHHNLELDPEKYPRQYKFIEELKERAKIAFSDGTSLTQTETLAWYMRMRQSIVWPDGIVIRDLRRDPETGETIGTGEILWPRTEADKPGESIIMDWAQDVILEAVESGDRIVCVSKFKTALKEMQRRLEIDGHRVIRFDGDTPDSKRQEIIDDFNANLTKHGEHKYDILLAQYDSTKVGLNLHGAQQMTFLDREWNPGMEGQMLDRVRRIDSQFDSVVHMPHVAGTATDLIDAIHEEKEAMLNNWEADVNLIEAMRRFLDGN